MTTLLLYALGISVGLAVYWLLVPLRWRRLFLLALSTLFIGSFGPVNLAYFLFNVVIVFAAAAAIRKHPEHKKRIVQGGLIWLIGSLCFFKYTPRLAGFLDSTAVRLPDVILPLGISYIIFRLIHYLVETYRGKTPAGSLVDFALYVLFFPTFLAGPVDRFPNFQPQNTAQKKFDLADFNYGLMRIVFGVIKKAVVADHLAPLVMPILNSPADYASWQVLLAVYGLAVQIYMDFSGYTDLAVGTARLFGYRIMENFNYPFFKKNIALFWRNWHISVYSFIRDYFFFPLFSRRPSLFKTSMGILCTMIVFMLWHEGNLSFFMLGVYHGAGLVIWQLFQEFKAKRPALRKALAHRWLDPIAVFATFSFVSFGFLFFKYNLAHIGSILQKIGVEW